MTGSAAGEGKVAVVTGGSRGMGREISSDFARRGFRVVIASRKAAACDGWPASCGSGTRWKPSG